MDFQYIQNQYDAVMDDIFDSSLMLTATVNIAAEQVPKESLYGGYSDSLDGRTDSIKKDFPDGVQEKYTIEVFPTEHGMKFGQDEGWSARPAGKVEEFDSWLSVEEEIAKVRGDSNMFELSENVEFQGDIYKVKGVVKELFGSHRILHIFMAKET